MTSGPALRSFQPSRPPRGSRLSPLAWIAATIVLALVAVAAAAIAWSGATLASDPHALARIDVQPFGGRLASERATTAEGRAIPLRVDHGRITPAVKLTPGEQVSVEVVVRRPGWIGWLIGKTRRETLSVEAPVANVTDRWLTGGGGLPLELHFDHPVASVAVRHRSRVSRIQLGSPGRSVQLPQRSRAGSVQVATAPRPWERFGPPVTVSWFPPSPKPVVLANPAPGAKIAPAAPITLTFSRPVGDVLGKARLALAPKTTGRWHQTDSHTLVFQPSGFGAPLGAHVHIDFPRSVALAADSGRSLRQGRRVEWTVPPGSTLRLHQLLAEEGYLPVGWQPDGAGVARTPRAEVEAAVNPPAGSFDWRYPNTPSELRGLWTPTQANSITRGAVMMFQDERHLTVDGFAGAQVWHALLADAIAGKRKDTGYSYVYVHRALPQSLTLWHNGHAVLRSPGNTGVPAAPTQLGTFTVFEHIPVGTMSGTNPDGSHYNDPGIRWISYFNGGDAIHAFTRASFGTPQSLGCVELPLAAAAKVYPYTPIGTLVTIEN